MAETKTAKKVAKKAPVTHETPEGASPVIIIKGKPLALRGRKFVGTVVSNRMTKTVTVEWERKKYLPKYQRYEKRRTRVKAHDEFNMKVGDKVEIMETRPISKTKNFVVVRKV